MPGKIYPNTQKCFLLSIIFSSQDFPYLRNYARKSDVFLEVRSFSDAFPNAVNTTGLYCGPCLIFSIFSNWKDNRKKWECWKVSRVVLREILYLSVIFEWDCIIKGSYCIICLGHINSDEFWLLLILFFFPRLVGFQWWVSNFHYRTLLEDC